MQLHFHLLIFLYGLSVPSGEHVMVLVCLRCDRNSRCSSCSLCFQFHHLRCIYAALVIELTYSCKSNIYSYFEVCKTEHEYVICNLALFFGSGIHHPDICIIKCIALVYSVIGVHFRGRLWMDTEQHAQGRGHSG